MPFDFLVGSAAIDIQPAVTKFRLEEPSSSESFLFPSIPVHIRDFHFGDLPLKGRLDRVPDLSFVIGQTS